MMMIMFYDDDDDEEEEEEEPNKGLSPQTQAETSHLAKWPFKE